MIPVVLTIAGSDSSGGAGIQADLKTFAALGVYGASAVTALTVQDTRQVYDVIHVPPGTVSAQMRAVFSDFDVKAVKIGLTGDDQVIGVIADGLARWNDGPVVVDPVLAASTGKTFMDDKAIEALTSQLFPLATLVTPNLAEAAKLLGMDRTAGNGDLQEQAEVLKEFGPDAVLITGGRTRGRRACDLYFDGRQFMSFEARRINGADLHGTGCTLSSAIAANLAQGRGTIEAIKAAKTYLTRAISKAGALDIGRGASPLDHFFDRH